ncbi:MAG TPA: hypothetical protein VHX88_13610 [Solirubrobacteraceae bacterium]|nr:hypothetical protein [Solirubrobacteraceae bacterium]
MSFELAWMRPEAPYMPIAIVGLLRALDDAGVPAAALWQRDGRGETLVLRTNASAERVAEAIINAPWPSLERIWDGAIGQAIGPMLAAEADPAEELRRLRAVVAERDRRAQAAGEPRLLGEARLLRALVTDAVLDDGGAPKRSRLLRGVKADLSGIADAVPLNAGGLGAELVDGPVWRAGKSGRGLGLVPEVQTFGGTTGRTPSDVGSHSALLFRLLWLGILAMPPIAVGRAGRLIVGGPLFTRAVNEDVVLSWPTWSFAVSWRGLTRLLTLEEVHAADEPALAAHGLTTVHQTTSVPINNMIGAFRWGERVA